MDNFRVLRAYRKATAPEAKEVRGGVKKIIDDLARPITLVSILAMDIIVLVVLLLVYFGFVIWWLMAVGRGRKARAEGSNSSDFEASAKTAMHLLASALVVIPAAALLLWPMLEHKIRVISRIRQLRNVANSVNGDWVTRVDREETGAGIRAAVSLLRSVREGTFRPGSEKMVTVESGDLPRVVGDYVCARILQERTGTRPSDTGDGDKSCGGVKKSESECAAAASAALQAIGNDSFTARQITDAWKQCPAAMTDLCRGLRGSQYEDSRALLQCESRIASMAARSFDISGSVPGDGWKLATADNQTDCFKLVRGAADGGVEAVYFSASDGKCRTFSTGAGQSTWKNSPGASGALVLRGDSSVTPPQFSYEENVRAVADSVAKEVGAASIGGIKGASSRLEDTLAYIRGKPSYAKDRDSQYVEITKAVLARLDADGGLTSASGGSLAAEKPVVEPQLRQDVEDWLSAQSGADMSASTLWPLFRAYPLMKNRTENVMPSNYITLVRTRVGIRAASVALVAGSVLAGAVLYYDLKSRLEGKDAAEKGFIITAMCFAIALAVCLGINWMKDNMDAPQTVESNTYSLLTKYRNMLKSLGNAVSPAWDLDTYLDGPIYKDAYDDRAPREIEAVRVAKNGLAALGGKLSPETLAEHFINVLDAFDRCNAVTKQVRPAFPLVDFLLYCTVLLSCLAGTLFSAGLVDVNHVVSIARRIRALRNLAETGDREALADLVKLVRSSAGDIDASYRELVTAVRWTFVGGAGVLIVRMLGDTVTGLATDRLPGGETATCASV